MKPWLAPLEVECLEYVLRKCKPEYALEYGSGGSTIHFSQFVLKAWIAVEHNRVWYEKVLQKLPAAPKAFVMYRDSPTTYVYGGQPYHSESGFDFIFIDGWKRIPCMIWSYIIAKPKGIVCVHDLTKPGYVDEDAVAQFRYTYEFKSRDGLLFLSKDRDLEKFFEGFDIEKLRIQEMLRD